MEEHHRISGSRAFADSVMQAEPIDALRETRWHEFRVMNDAGRRRVVGTSPRIISSTSSAKSVTIRPSSSF
jgi:hypothetical protein